MSESIRFQAEGMPARLEKDEEEDQPMANKSWSDPIKIQLQGQAWWRPVRLCQYGKTPKKTSWNPVKPRTSLLKQQNQEMKSILNGAPQSKPSKTQ